MTKKTMIVIALLALAIVPLTVGAFTVGKRTLSNEERSYNEQLASWHPVVDTITVINSDGSTVTARTSRGVVVHGNATELFTGDSVTVYCSHDNSCRPFQVHTDYKAFLLGFVAFLVLGVAAVFDVVLIANLIFRGRSKKSGLSKGTPMVVV